MMMIGSKNKNQVLIVNNLQRIVIFSGGLKRKRLFLSFDWEYHNEKMHKVFKCRFLVPAGGFFEAISVSLTDALLIGPNSFKLGWITYLNFNFRLGF